jgi:hypothetical protein
MRISELDPLGPGNLLGLWPKQIELARAVRQAMDRGEALEVGLVHRSPRRALQDGEECGHPGCRAHISHPCEGCGRIGGRGPVRA